LDNTVKFTSLRRVAGAAVLMLAAAVIAVPVLAPAPAGVAPQSRPFPLQEAFVPQGSLAEAVSELSLQDRAAVLSGQPATIVVDVQTGKIIQVQELP